MDEFNLSYENVFDFVKDFYTQDPDWGTIVSQDVCEGFLRQQSWNGADDERLFCIWEHLLVFMLYCGHAETMPGDMTVEDCIQSLGWCSRNVGEFKPEADYISDYMQTVADFYDYMCGKHAVTRTGAMRSAFERLFGQGQFNALGADGYFQGDYERFNRQGIPDLPARLFINLGAQMTVAMQMLEGDFIARQYAKDLERAKKFYDTFGADGVYLSSNPDEQSHAFYDYFCFDYKLLSTGRPLIEDLAEKITADLSGVYPKVLKATFQELAKAKLMLFSVQKNLGNGTFSVLDVVRNQTHVMMLPLEDGAATQDVLFCGHTFCDNTMIVNFLRGSRISPQQLRQLLDLFRRLKRYYAVRQGGKCEWDDFIQHNRLLVRLLPVLLANNIPLNEDFASDLLGYQPARLPDNDPVSPVIIRLLSSDFFTPEDRRLATNIWADILAKDASGEIPEDSALLGIAVSRIYVDLCNFYGFNPGPIKDKETKLLHESAKALARELKKYLQIKQFDPRYVSEEGLLIMLLQRKQEK